MPRNELVDAQSARVRDARIREQSWTSLRTGPRPVEISPTPPPDPSDTPDPTGPTGPYYEAEPPAVDRLQTNMETLRQMADEVTRRHLVYAPAESEQRGVEPGPTLRLNRQSSTYTWEEILPLQQPSPLQLEPEEEEIPNDVRSGRTGPRIYPIHTDGVCSTCQICQSAVVDKQLKTVDGIQACVKCVKTYSMCQLCRCVIPEEQLKLGTYVHLYCPECGNTSGKRLNIKQNLECKPKTNVLITRKGRVWQTSSISEQTPKA